jgi:hypothetical protein
MAKKEERLEEQPNFRNATESNETRINEIHINEDQDTPSIAAIAIFGTLFVGITICGFHKIMSYYNNGVYVIPTPFVPETFPSSPTSPNPPGEFPLDPLQSTLHGVVVEVGDESSV